MIYQLTVLSFERIRDGVMNHHSKTFRYDELTTPIFMFNATTVPSELILTTVIAPEA